MASGFSWCHPFIIVELIAALGLGQGCPRPGGKKETHDNTGPEYVRKCCHQFHTERLGTIEEDSVPRRSHLIFPSECLGRPVGTLSCRWGTNRRAWWGGTAQRRTSFSENSTCLNQCVWKQFRPEYLGLLQWHSWFSKLLPTMWRRVCPWNWRRTNWKKEEPKARPPHLTSKAEPQRLSCGVTRERGQGFSALRDRLDLWIP